MSGVLSDHAEHLYRQARSVDDDGYIHRTNFMPSADDKGRLSVDRALLCSPKSAFELAIKNSIASKGCYAVSVGEAAEHELPTESSPIEESEGVNANPAHCEIDFNGVPNNSQIGKRAGKLRDKAAQRGKMYP